MARRSCSTWWSIQRASSRLSDSCSSARAARRSVSMWRCSSPDDAAEGPHGAPDGPEHQAVDQQQQRRAARGQRHEGVPGVEHRARGVRAHLEPAAGEGEGLHRLRRQHQRGEPVRRVAAGLVRGRRGFVKPRAGVVRQRDLVGAHAAELLQVGQQRRRALRRDLPRGAVQQLRGDAVGRDRLFLHRVAHAAQLHGQQRRDEGQRQRADDQVDLQAQAVARHGGRGGGHRGGGAGRIGPQRPRAGRARPGEPAPRRES
ncbi:hypothetical protein ABXN37_28480 [Piscinibacter sakaiensis]|uniref:hypothetical protein n=1 Tax=Piscinibacter sakaiensis TaxID=1547922 RepID=UPI0037266811